MRIKIHQKFTSRRTGDVIKVTKIERSTVNSKWDRYLISDTDSYGKVIKGTQRSVFSNSIQRRYL